MHKDALTTGTNLAISAGGIANSCWLWLTDPNAAHLVTVLTVILILSQLIWGWRKFFKERS